jgi:hypothetical protein
MALRCLFSFTLLQLYLFLLTFLIYISFYFTSNLYNYIHLILIIIYLYNKVYPEQTIVQVRCQGVWTSMGLVKYIFFRNWVFAQSNNETSIDEHAKEAYYNPNYPRRFIFPGQY